MFTLDEKAVATETTEAYNKFLAYIASDSRADALNVMYTKLHDQLITAPASSRTYFHNCFPGGYIDHIVRVAELALKLAATFKSGGANITFTKEELIFSALHHDLGKLGDGTDPYYLDQDSEWHRKRGELYKINENIQYFKVPERGLLLLQQHGITVTEQEWLSIKLSDGLYCEGNSSYLKNNGMKTDLPYIIHWADNMATRIEKHKNSITF
jgi:hypothetical protein